MLFNSFVFLYFFTAVFFIYWLLCNKSVKIRNAFLLMTCVLFYAVWDWRFLGLLFLNIGLTYFLALEMQKTEEPRKRKTLLLLGLLQGLGALFYFKYTGFFLNSLVDLGNRMGASLDHPTLQILLPLGISFYTFRSVGYLLDVYNEKIDAEPAFINYACFVAFFPTLMSGPIDRAGHLMPQLRKIEPFNYNLVVDGMRQFLWGIFKKMVIADGCSDYVNTVFSDSAAFSGSTLFVGLFYYTIQIYMDFSGYSDMAIGVAKMLGFRIARNFQYPYFARNIADYWRRWHISLTSWLTEFIFTPVSVSMRDYGEKALILGILLTFLASGLWHGANWTFVVWGFLNGLYFIPLILRKKMNKKPKYTPNRFLPTFPEATEMGMTFLLVMFTNIFFRADSLGSAARYLSGICSRSLFSYPALGINYLFLLLILLVFCVEWIQKEKEYALQIDSWSIRPVRWAVYMILFFSLFQFYGQPEREFIYFQF